MAVFFVMFGVGLPARRLSMFFAVRLFDHARAAEATNNLTVFATSSVREVRLDDLLNDF